MRLTQQHTHLEKKRGENTGHCFIKTFDIMNIYCDVYSADTGVNCFCIEMMLAYLCFEQEDILIIAMCVNYISCGELESTKRWMEGSSHDDHSAAFP